MDTIKVVTTKVCVKWYWDFPPYEGPSSNVRGVSYCLLLSNWDRTVCPLLSKWHDSTVSFVLPHLAESPLALSRLAISRLAESPLALSRLAISRLAESPLALSRLAISRLAESPLVVSHLTVFRLAVSVSRLAVSRLALSVSRLAMLSLIFYRLPCVNKDFNNVKGLINCRYIVVQYIYVA